MLTIAKVEADMHAEMAAAGFIHVTGLKETLFGNSRRATLIDTNSHDLGHAGGNNGRLVIYDTAGRVWLASASIDRAIHHKQDAVMTKYAPKVRGGVYVPCSNGGVIGDRAILARAADPDWNPKS